MTGADHSRPNSTPRSRSEGASGSGDALRARGRHQAVVDLDRASAAVGELLGGILVWGGLGWIIGTKLGVHPWPFVVGTLVGFAGGFYLLWLRAQGRVGRSAGDTSADASDPEPPPASRELPERP